MEKKVTLKKFCPLVENPYEDCYCNNLKSQTIQNIIYYCGNNFEKCDIYKNHKLNQIKNSEGGVVSLYGT